MRLLPLALLAATAVSAQDWPTYNGSLSANRHSALTRIDAQNVNRLKLAWTYTLPYVGLQTTPLVASYAAAKAAR